LADDWIEAIEKKEYTVEMVDRERENEAARLVHVY
jgi:hypothetical protein